ncbi:MAG: hypothetical protein QXH42_06315 [Thermoplasmata archaeon]
MVRRTGTMAGRWGTREGDTVVIPAPIELDELMKRVPEGKLATINQLRAALPKKRGSTIGCPIPTGIFACLAVEAAAELASRRERGKPLLGTPKQGGEIDEKYPGVFEGLGRLLWAEGFGVLRRGREALRCRFREASGGVLSRDRTPGECPGMPL